MSDVTIVVGQNYRDIASVRRFVTRELKNGRAGSKASSRALHLRSGAAASQGDAMAKLAAARVGCPVVAHTATSLTPGGLYLLNVEMVEPSDWIVVFDDGGAACDHICNVATADKKRLTRYRETQQVQKVDNE